LNNQIGIVSCHIGYKTLEEAFEKVLSWGLESVEWFESDLPEVSSPEQSTQIVSLSEECNIGCSYHAPWLGRWDLGMQDAAAARNTIGDILENTRRLGAGLVTVHMGGFDPAAGRDCALDRLAEALTSSVTLAERMGIRICLENSTICFNPHELGIAADDFSAVFDAVPSPAVGMTLDVGHANITGNLRHLIELFWPRIYNAHIHDTDGRTDGHLPPGGGTVDWAGLLAMLREFRYAGPFNLEFPHSGDSYQNTIEMIRSA